MNKYKLIRKIYLYLVSLIGIVLIVIGCFQLVNLGLKTFIFTKADNSYVYPMATPAAAPDLKGGAAMQQPSQTEIDQYQKDQLSSQRQRDVSGSLALLIVGLPLYLYHWGVIKKDKDESS